MAKTRRMLADSLKLVDLAIETLDARAPFSSQNPDVSRMLAGKQKIVALNKSDLADPDANAAWRAWFKGRGAHSALVDARSGKGTAALSDAIARAAAAKSAPSAKRGVVMRPMRVMVVGVPNSGKSTVINRLAGRASAITGDKPGVTRSKQWIRISDGVELMDTPGVLWPKFEDEWAGFCLAATGAVKDDVLDSSLLAERLLSELSRLYPGAVEARYRIAIAGDVKNQPAREACGIFPAASDSDGLIPCDSDGLIPFGGDGLLSCDREGGGAVCGGRSAGDGGSIARDPWQDGQTPLLEAVCRTRGFLARGGLLDVSRAAAIVLDEFRGGKIGRITLETPR